MKKYRIVATAGHVDHGKSSLVQGLTSVNPDRLPEEKERGITIELGFAHITLKDKKKQEDELVVGIVDVPGHENFVKNMVTGVGAIDAALLIVAADDGWMPQTEEHLQILEYLGVKHGVIALTKKDLVSSEDLELAIEFIKEEVAGTFLESAPIVAISNKSGEGIDTLKSVLPTLFSFEAKDHSAEKARLSIDRIFSRKGIGTVVTGTLIDGCISKDQAVTIIPGNIKSRVRSIQTYNENVETSSPGTRTAINLAHVEIHSSTRSKEGTLHKGSVVLTDLNPQSTEKLHVRIERSKRLESGQYQVNRELKHNTVVRLHSGSGNYKARLSLQGKRQLLHGENCFAQIKLEFPIHVKIGDRFIIRDWSQKATLAGGIVIDPQPVKYKISHKNQINLLAQRSDSGFSLKQCLLSQIERDHFIDLSHFDKWISQPKSELEQTLASLGEEVKILEKNQILVDSKWWNHFLNHAEYLILKEHENKPEKIGFKSQSLSSNLQRNGFPQEFIAELKEELISKGFKIKGDFIHHSSHEISLPKLLKPSAEKIICGLRNDPLSPGNLRELIISENDKKALRFLTDSGEVVEVSDTIFIPTEIFNGYVKDILDFIESHGPATVSELKDVIRASRKIMVPFLELLDARGFTKRDGDKRTVA